MPQDQRTKHLLARKFREMLKEMSFTSVTITELSKRARVTNQAFYYHFHDKYELVAWMFLNEFTPTLYMPDGYTPEVAALQYEHYYSEKDFWVNLFHEMSRTNTISYLRDFTIDYLTASMLYYLHADRLDADTERWIRYQAYGMQGMLMDWMMGVIKMTPQEFGEFQYKYMREDFRQAMAAYGAYLAETTPAE